MRPRSSSSLRRRVVASLVVTASAASSLSACDALLDDFVYVDASAPPGDEVTPGSDADADATSSASDASSDSAADAAAPPDTDADAEGGDALPPATYAAIILAANPGAYWRLGESVGPTATSLESPVLFNARYYADVALAVPGAIVGDPDTAIHLSGDTGAVIVPGGFSFFDTRPFTFELWIRPTVAASSSFTFLIKADAPATTLALVYQETRGSALYGVESRDSVSTYDNSVTDPVVSAWSYVVFESDGTNLLLFLDGHQVAIQPLGVTDAGGGGDASPLFAIGGDENGYSSFTGDIDEVAVYPRQLPTVEILRHYLAGNGRDAGM